MEKYNTLLNLAFELEGLAKLALSREVDDTLNSLIKDKIQELTDLFPSEKNIVASSPTDEDVFYALPDDEYQESASSQSPFFEPLETVPADSPAQIEESEIFEVSEDTFSPEDAGRRERPVLSVNDRFRFRRELFSNSDSDFNAALNAVATMDSYDEAEAYFLHQLDWNPEERVVEEFLEMLRRYFK